MNSQSRYAGPLYLTDSEDEYAQAFRDAGWSEHAIEIELERFRAFKQGRDLDHAMTMGEAFASVRQQQASQPEPEPSQEEDGLLAALGRVRSRKKPVD